MENSLLLLSFIISPSFKCRWDKETLNNVFPPPQHNAISRFLSSSSTLFEVAVKNSLARSQIYEEL